LCHLVAITGLKQVPRLRSIIRKRMIELRSEWQVRQMRQRG
jgi:hypothetical protein